MFRNLPTFKSLPSAIGLPFLSSQEDAQLKFRSGDNGIKRLYSDEVIPLSDFGYWAQFYTLFSSAQDVYSLISVQDVRQTLQSNPTNLGNLLSTLSHHLFTLLPSPLFPGTSTSASSQDPTKELLNCLRVLGRLIVVIYESEADARDKHIRTEETFAWKWLWRRMKAEEVRDRGYEMGEELDGDEVGAEHSAVDSRNGELEDGGQFTIADDSDDDDENEGGDISGAGDEGARAFKAVVGNPPKSATESSIAEVQDPLQSSVDNSGPKEGQEEEKEESIPSLIDRLFSCTIDLLFCAGFTVPESVKGLDGDKINYVIWEKGVGSTVNVGSSAELDRNKTEVLRFLMILLSTTIYLPPHSLPTTPNLPLEHLTHSLERRLVLSLLCSLLNASLTSSKANAGVTGQIPYNHLISKGGEERRILVRASMMTLLVALDYKKVTPSDGEREMGEGKDDNAFRYFVSKLHRKEDFAFILQGILGILEEHSQVANGYLPGSKKPIPYILETFMLFWRMIDLNKRFRAHLYDSGKAVDITIYILLTCLELKDDPANHGLLRLLSYVLQTLSADAAFAQCLNQSVRLGVPAKWAVAGTAADFLIVSIYSIATTPGLNPLFPALTISISNISPHLRNVGVQASTRLMQLFKAFSAPSFLLADEGHPRLVYYLLETINSVLYHQFNENPNFVYSVLRSHQDFQTLATFTLMSGLRDIQKKKANRIESKKDTPTRGLQRTNSEMEMMAEKAALLSTTSEEDDIPRLTSDQPPQSPIDERRDPSLSIPTPGENNTDPLTTIPVPGREGMSEKARGKMRAVDPSALVDGEDGMVDVADEELLKVAAGGIGPGGYVPTQEWVSSWQKGLPLDPVLVSISELLPKLQDTQRPSSGPSSKIFNLLKDPSTHESLLEHLPPSQGLQPRRFQWSAQSHIWFTSLLWGDIYVAGLMVWRDTTVRLFGVKQAVNVGRGAQVGRVLRRFGVV